MVVFCDRLLIDVLVGCQGESFQTERTNSVSGVSTEQLTRHATVKKNMNRSVCEFD